MLGRESFQWVRLLAPRVLECLLLGKGMIFLSDLTDNRQLEFPLQQSSQMAPPGIGFLFHAMATPSVQICSTDGTQSLTILQAKRFQW